MCFLSFHSGRRYETVPFFVVCFPLKTHLEYKKRKSICFSASNSNRFLLEGCTNGIRAGGRVAGTDVDFFRCAVTYAVVINTVGNVARNALVAFTGFTCLLGGGVCVHDDKPNSVPESERRNPFNRNNSSKKASVRFSGRSFSGIGRNEVEKSNMFCRFDVPYLIKYHIRQSRRFYFAPSMVRLYTDRLIFL